MTFLEQAQIRSGAASLSLFSLFSKSYAAVLSENAANHFSLSDNCFRDFSDALYRHFGTMAAMAENLYFYS